MCTLLPQNATPRSVPVPGRLAAQVGSNIGRLKTHRRAIRSYVQVLAGTGGRVALQAIYFVVLVNTLSLASLGVFASVSAAGVMIGCFAGFGFQSFVFRSAAGRKTSLSAYLAAYYVCFVLAIPIMAAASALFYGLMFKDSISLLGYTAIMIAELVLWRLIELVIQLNNGLGRYSTAALTVWLSTGLRAAAALAFWFSGGGSVSTWAAFYLSGNFVAVAVAVLLLLPRIRMRFRRALLIGRLREALLYAYWYLVFIGQSEVDKIVVLCLGGERIAGTYSIAMRIIDLTAVPLRPVLVLYSRKLVQTGRAARQLIQGSLKIEGLVAAGSVAAIFSVIITLSACPNLLGSNVAGAAGMLSALVAVPAVKNLLELHCEILYGLKYLTTQAALTSLIVISKALGLAVFLIEIPDARAWAGFLNLTYVLVYLVSFLVVYATLKKNARSFAR